MKLFKKLSIHYKLFICMSLISAISMIVLLCGTSLLFCRTLFRNEINSSIKELDYITSQLDSYILTTENYSKTIISNEIVQTNAKIFNDNKKQYNAYLQLQINGTILNTIQATPYFYSIGLYSKDSTPITSIGGTQLPEPIPYNPDKLTWIDQTKPDKFKKQVHLLSLIRPFFSVETGRHLGYIEINIDESSISDIYTQKTSEVSHIYMVDPEGYTKSSDKSRPLGSVIDTSNFSDSKTGYYFNKKCIVFYKYYEKLNWYIVNEIRYTFFLKPFYPVLQIALLITLACLIIIFYVSHKISRTITSPIYHLIDHTQKIKEGEWIEIDEKAQDRDISILYEEFNSMIVAQNDLFNRLLNAQKLKKQTSLDLLQQQVNPHFLYNTLDNICSLAEIDEKETLIRIVMNLSTFYRNTLSKGKTHVTIEEELQITKAYLEIMQVRYYQKFEYTIECGESLYTCSCIKLLLQPIIENSIYHGVKNSSKKGLIEIKVTEQDGHILFTVRDNGNGFTEEQYNNIWSSTNHFGVKNVLQRIQLYYGENFGLTMENNETGGCTTKITIPKEEQNAVECRNRR